MKSYLILLIFITNVSFAATNESQLMESLLTDKELKMHNCIKSLDKNSPDFYKKANQCVKGSQYHQSRTPSSTEMEMSENIINTNSWIFGSDIFQVKFLSTIRKLNKARKHIKKVFKKVTHGTGIGVHGSAYFGVGVNWIGEIMLHDGKLALFCAPGLSIQPAAGAALGFLGVKSLSCKNNQHYTGGFLTAALGFNTSTMGLPFSIQGSYSLGIDLKEFIRDLKQANKTNEIDYEEFAQELKLINKVFSPNASISPGAKLAFFFGIKATTLLNKMADIGVDIPKDVVSGDIPVSSKFMKKKIRDRKSIGDIIKSEIDQLQATLTKLNLPQTSKYFELINNNISGCDAIGGSAAISPSIGALLPFEVSIAYYNYHMLLSMSDIKFMAMKSLSAFSLLNPYFLGSSMLTDIALVGRKILNMPKEVKKYCFQDNLFRN